MRVNIQKSFASLAVASGLAVGSFGAAQAQEVVLTSISTGFTLTGPLLDFDGEKYVINSSIGRLAVLAKDVECRGACPANRTADGLTEVFGVVGSNTIGATLMPGLIEAYSFALGGEFERVVGGEGDVFRVRDEKGVEVAAINIEAIGSDSAFPGLLSGDAAIGMASRPIRESEAKALEDSGAGRLDRAGTEHILALDGVVVIVSPDNQIGALNIADVAAIYAGDIDNWAALGGADAPIVVHSRGEESGTWDTFHESVMKPYGGELAADARLHETDRALADAVATDRNAIGIVGLAFQRSAKVLPIEGSCGLVFEPTEFNVKTEEYPLSRRLYLYTTSRPLPAPARGLLDYALSDDAQLEIADIGFVDQSISSISLNQQGRRIAEAFIAPRKPEEIRLMRDLALELLDAERLSTTLRFQPRSSVLDVKSEADLTRLARHIGGGAYADKQIVLIGFADDDDRFEAAMNLSTQRAAQIGASLEAELARSGGSGDVDIVTMGYGSLAPVACSDDEFTTTTNRRVEVWVRNRF